MSFIDTESISVFPLAKNRPSDRSARLFYENNVANIIRQVIDTQGFIIKPELQLSDNFFTLDSLSDDNKITLHIEQPLTFNLGGYYFDVGRAYTKVKIFKEEQLTPDQVKNGFEVWAHIHLDVLRREIMGQDEEGVYQGLVFSTSCIYGRLCYNLKIADCWFEDGVFKSRFASDSYIKTNTNSLKITRIDGLHD